VLYFSFNLPTMQQLIVSIHGSIHADNCMKQLSMTISSLTHTQFVVPQCCSCILLIRPHKTQFYYGLFLMPEWLWRAVESDPYHSLMC